MIIVAITLLLLFYGGSLGDGVLPRSPNSLLSVLFVLFSLFHSSILQLRALQIQFYYLVLVSDLVQWFALNNSSISQNIHVKQNKTKQCRVYGQ